TREKGEIAMMKSVGFRYRSICNWQVGRMTLVVLASFLILVPLSLLSNQYLLKPIFAIMGAEVDIQIDFLQVYVVYPGILLAGVMIATLLAVHGVKRVDIREMNNLE
ncbi:MAG: FtsX-like permease family protein, partial [Longicatena sp.]